MADVAPNSFENLTQSGLLKLTSKEDKNVSLTIDTYMGNTSFVVFTGAGGKPWKFAFPAKVRAALTHLLKKMKAEPRPCREPVFLNEFLVEENGRRKIQQKGCIGFGIGDDLVPYIDVAATDLGSNNQRFLFPVKGDARFDFSNTSFAEKDTVISLLDVILEAFDAVKIAERMSSFKRTGGPGGGGNRGNFGGNSGGGNKSFGGGGGGGNSFGQQNRSSQQSTTFGGGPDIDNDLHI